MNKLAKKTLLNFNPFALIRNTRKVLAGGGASNSKPKFSVREKPQTKFSDIKIAEKAIKEHIDIVFLALIFKEPLSGEDLIKFIHERFGVFLGSSTVYPVLNQLEKDGFIKHKKAGKMKIYTVPPKSRKAVKGLISRVIAINQNIVQLVRQA